MKIYFSGICGTGLGPLALFAKKAGHTVVGSDREKGAIYGELQAAGITVHLGAQDDDFLRSQLDDLDWFVYTSALPQDHPELTLAKASGVKTTKRDDFTAYLIDQQNLKLVAIAGTHGKTTTTSMIIYASQQLNLPVSYVVGTTLGFAPSGNYKKGDQFFVYEADEYDRNFLKFRPWLSVIPSVSYDHPDIYPTRADYKAAFDQFESQSRTVITPEDISPALAKSHFTLAGDSRRLDACLATAALEKIIATLPNHNSESATARRNQIINILNTFPGVGRRFEKLTDHIYTDYAHHPEEISATIATALDEVERAGRTGLVVIYEPHQNTRQHQIKDQYYDAFIGADHVFWLPTYLVREDPTLPTLTPLDFIHHLAPQTTAEPAELNDELFQIIQNYAKQNYLVLLMTAGPADPWLRERLAHES